MNLKTNISQEMLSGNSSLDATRKHQMKPTTNFSWHGHARRPPQMARTFDTHIRGARCACIFLSPLKASGSPPQHRRGLRLHGDSDQVQIIPKTKHLHPSISKPDDLKLSPPKHLKARWRRNYLRAESKLSAGAILYLHCGDIFTREAVSGVGDEHTRLAHCTIPNHHTLDWPRLWHRSASPATVTRSTWLLSAQHNVLMTLPEHL